MAFPTFLLWFAAGLAIGLLTVGIIAGAARLFSWLHHRYVAPD